MALMALFLFSISLDVLSAFSAPVSAPGSIIPSASIMPATVVPPPPIPTVTQTALEIVTSTVFVTELSPTIVLTAPPSTFTETVTVSATPSSTAWSAPAQMTDLSAFNISAFPGGQQNLRVVQGIPASASATQFAVAAESTASPGIALAPQPTWDNATSVLELLYPADSIDPANKPRGGAEFYATPLPAMKSASNVTLEYSVFFPQGFDWVLGGKLPGLYGGHTGCSGGDDAADCFSTRLMWRPDGMGELYLYAPKDKQTHELCVDPQSMCDVEYGFSIGRGSFNFKAGAWTNVKQTVVLNTPGMQDGKFLLAVDGRNVINRTDVFYRDAPKPPTAPAADAPPAKPKPAPEAQGQGGLLGGLFGGLFSGGLRRRQGYPVDNRPPLLPVPHDMADVGDLQGTDDAAASLIAITNTITTVVTSTIPAPSSVAGPTTTMTLTASPILASSGPITVDAAHAPGKPVGFSGLFFSTFFGGHEEQYATPRDQYTWFKDFAISM